MRLTYDYVNSFFDNLGYKLLSRKYKNARIHLDYICPNNHYGKVIFDSFRRGHRCNTCAQLVRNKKQTSTQDEVQQYFLSHGCTLLSQYEKAQKPVRFKCICGNVSEIQFANFRNRKRCSKCGLNARSGENHYEWRHDRENYRMQIAFRGRMYAMMRIVRNKFKLKKSSRTEKSLGYSLEQLRASIESHPNWGKIKDSKWHLDHIFPIKAFLDHQVYDLKVVNALDNLQPLAGGENISKSDAYDEKLFIKWLQQKGITDVEQL